MADVSWSTGTVLLGKYRVERVLGEGGMGVVVAATHLALNERVAIKFLLPSSRAKGATTARFLREARAAVRIKSEHVARVFDVGTLDNGAPYMVMEHLTGSDLARLLAERGPLPHAAAVEYLLQACEALAHAHVRGIIHRDLKPANLFLTARADGSPCVKVLDFGISRAALSDEEQRAVDLTHSSAVLGTPLYMSPEQMRSARLADARSDIWSIGATLHELIAGKPPFLGESITELCSAIVTEVPPALRSLRPDVPEELSALVLRCLEKDPARRPQDVAELAAALAPLGPERARSSLGRISAVVAAGDSSPPGAPDPPLASPVSPTAPLPVTAPLPPSLTLNPVSTPWVPPGWEAQAAPAPGGAGSDRVGGDRALPPATLEEKASPPTLDAPAGRQPRPASGGRPGGRAFGWAVAFGALGLLLGGGLRLSTPSAGAPAALASPAPQPRASEAPRPPDERASGAPSASSASAPAPSPPGQGAAGGRPGQGARPAASERKAAPASSRPDIGY